MISSLGNFSYNASPVSYSRAIFFFIFKLFENVIATNTFGVSQAAAAKMLRQETAVHRSILPNTEDSCECGGLDSELMQADAAPWTSRMCDVFLSST